MNEDFIARFRDLVGCDSKVRPRTHKRSQHVFDRVFFTVKRSPVVTREGRFDPGEFVGKDSRRTRQVASADCVVERLNNFLIGSGHRLLSDWDSFENRCY